VVPKPPHILGFAMAGHPNLHVRGWSSFSIQTNKTTRRYTHTHTHTHTNLFYKIEFDTIQL
jgi:hypothetical protein